MSNIYTTYADLAIFYDARTLAQLSADDDSGALTQATVEAIIDTAASELDSILAGRYSVTAGNVPKVLTRWVAAKAMGMALMRRNKTSDAVKEDCEWADDWADKLIARKINLAGMSRTNTVEVVMGSSGEPTHSRFDNIPYGDRSIPGGTGNT